MVELMTDVERAVADAHRREWAYVLAATVRVARDVDAAEEAVQDAYVQALRTWARDGVPERPGAWLTTVARRNALNAARSRRTLESKLPLLLEAEETEMPQPADPDPIPDDRLRLIFTCCHPALAEEAQIALTLRLVCGVATPDIAQAFLVAEPTMAARLTRAKKKIADGPHPLRRAVGGRASRARRRRAGRDPPALLRRPHRALRRRPRPRRTHRPRARPGPDAPPAPAGRARGRRTAGPAARAPRPPRHPDRPGRPPAAAGGTGPLRWDRELIAEADRLVVAALHAGPPGRFTLQAAIAALHAQAPCYADTDWPQIRVLYDELLRIWPSPVVALNRAVAVSMADGPDAALAEVEMLERDGRLAGYRYLAATKADLLHRLGRDTEAVVAYRAALALTDNLAEQEFLAGRVQSMEQGP